MSVTEFGNVVKFPKELKLALYPEVDFTYEFAAPDGHTVTETDLVTMTIVNPFDSRVFARLTAENIVATNRYRFHKPHEQLEYLDHGARYRIYLQYGLPATKFIHQTGPFVWIGR